MTKIKFYKFHKGMTLNLGGLVLKVIHTETKRYEGAIGLSCHVTLVDENNEKVYMFGKPDDEINATWKAEVV